MDGDLKAYLDTNFSQINTRIEGVEKTMQATIRPIEQTIDRHTGDIKDLYDMHRKQTTMCENHREKTGERISSVEAWKSGVELESGSKKWRSEQVIIVAMALVTAGIGLAAAFIGR